MEKWKWVIGYEGYYQVSEEGRVRSVDRVVTCRDGTIRKLKGRLLRFHPNNGGYLQVKLSKNGVEQSKGIHQLVAAAFIGPCPKGQEVRHGPQGQWGNSVYNLCYGTPSENQLDRVRDGRDSSRPVRRSDGEEYRSLAVAARESGCWASDICTVCKGRQKTAGGFGWEYIE